jgi:pimeloyl-ACP methyl ester carboxylesterase
MVTSELTAESTSRVTEAGGINVHYNEAGSGPAVIMLHGGGAGASGWSNFNLNIGPLSQNHRVLLVDQINFGRTGRVETDEPGSQRNARMLRDLMDALGIEKASLVGNSMGGSTALNFAIDFPDRTDKVVIMGPAAGARASITQPTPTEGQKALAAAGANPTVETLKHLFQLMVYDSSFVTDELLQQRVQAALANRRQGGGGGQQPQRDLMNELDKVEAETLVIWGRDDRVVPLDGALRFVWGLPNAQLHVYSKCGHWAQFEKFDDFNRLVGDFLR